jgi:hypothetical protein
MLIRHDRNAGEHDDTPCASTIAPRMPSGRSVAVRMRPCVGNRLYKYLEEASSKLLIKALGIPERSNRKAIFKGSDLGVSRVLPRRTWILLKFASQAAGNRTPALHFPAAEA